MGISCRQQKYNFEATGYRILFCIKLLKSQESGLLDSALFLSYSGPID